MRKIIRASVLILALAIPAFAGDIPNDVTSKPPTNATTQAGDIQNGVTGDIPYDVTSVWLNLLVALIA